MLQVKRISRPFWLWSDLRKMVLGVLYRQALNNALGGSAARKQVRTEAERLRSGRRMEPRGSPLPPLPLGSPPALGPRSYGERHYANFTELLMSWGCGLRGAGLRGRAEGPFVVFLQPVPIALQPE